jgi:hypothetical protein
MAFLSQVPLKLNARSISIHTKYPLQRKKKDTIHSALTRKKLSIIQALITSKKEICEYNDIFTKGQTITLTEIQVCIYLFFKNTD